MVYYLYIPFLPMQEVPNMQLSRIQSIDNPLFAPFWSLMEQSFPLWERRAKAEQLLLLRQPDYHCEALLHDGQFAGLLCWWQLAQTAYLEHLAILPALRGQSLGGQAVGLLQSVCPSIVLEIDPPVDSISRRRLGFYQRLGFIASDYDYRQPAYRVGMDNVPLRLLSWPQALTEPAQFETLLHQTLAPFVSPG